MSEQTTVDGVPVKLGDIVWTVRPGFAVRSRKLDKVDLGMWWEMRRTEIYSNEEAALRAAIDAEKQRIAKAKAEVRRATKAIERLSARLGGLR